MTRRGLTFLVAGALTVILGVLAAVLPVPYVVLVPGPVTDTLGSVGAAGHERAVVSVRGARTYPTSGQIFLTTVGVIPGSCDAEPSLVQTLRAWLDSTQAVEPHQVVCPPDQTSSAVQQQNAQDMSTSQRAAVTAALLQLGYHPTRESLLVADVSAGTPAAKVLQAGDVIVAVDGTAVSTPDRLRALISARAVGDPVQLTIRRGDTTQDVKVTTIDAGDGRAVIGITPDVQATFAKVDVRIGINPQQVGGPSAGLAFALGIVDKLSPSDLTGGKAIAVTGTITGLGVVGPIGGIQQKIAGAVRQGASIFLAPAADCADAKGAAPASLTLVKVSTLADAITSLESLASGGTDYPRC